MNEWAQYIWIATSLLAASIIIGLVSLLVTFGREYAAVQQEEQNSIAIMKEYRKYNQYDGTTVYSQDVVTLIAESRGIPIIELFKKGRPLGRDINGKYIPDFLWDSSSSKESFSPTYLSTLLASEFGESGTFTSKIIKGKNGEILIIDIERD
ncbi:hypothetical protein [Cytobacillus sp. IB215316]|uniref:hypothetical protein n=1 Tax=Cytobacillus sp. IB215316 TaxID=3097354 RepID=UPI002A0BE1B7|nr:hypothetical protein [Cytobacillus sp. IB215316]MDX8360766.1 hypothetical protein [Cytobacillus sp. IB215316]